MSSIYTRVHTLYVSADNNVRVFELVEAQLKELITLPAFPADPRQIVLDAARGALFVREYNKDEVCTSARDGGTWTAWRMLTRSHTDKLLICCICMPTPNILLLYDDHSAALHCPPPQMAARSLRPPPCLPAQPASNRPHSPKRHTNPQFVLTRVDTPTDMGIEWAPRLWKLAYW